MLQIVLDFRIMFLEKGKTAPPFMNLDEVFIDIKFKLKYSSIILAGPLHDDHRH